MRALTGQTPQDTNVPAYIVVVGLTVWAPQLSSLLYTTYIASSESKFRTDSKSSFCSNSFWGT